MIVQFMNHRVKYSVVCFSCVRSSSSTVGSLGSRTLIGARWCGRSRRAWRSLSHSSRYRAHVQGSFTVPRWCVMAEGVVSRPFLLWFMVHRNPPPKSLKTRTGPLSLKMWVGPTHLLVTNVTLISENPFGRPLAYERFGFTAKGHDNVSIEM